MKRKHIILILLAITGIWCIWKANHYFLWWNNNTISVTAEDPLTIDSIKIQFGVSAMTINRENDQALFENNGGFCTIYDAGSESSIHTDYGENDFLVTYGNTWYYSFRQFKTNRRNQNDYNFSFRESHDSIFLGVNIEGPNAMLFERAMLKTAEATAYRCNTPVDSADHVYNMIEMNRK